MCEKCKYCKKKLDKTERTIDHVIPKFRGGLDTKDNLVTACIECNQEKSCMTGEEFFKYKELTSSSNLIEKAVIREIILYNIFNNREINFTKLEKFLKLNIKDQHYNKILFKINNENNLYKSAYTKICQQNIQKFQYKNELEEIKNEIKAVKMKLIKNTNSSNNNSNNDDIGINKTLNLKDICITKQMQTEIDNLYNSKKFKENLKQYEISKLITSCLILKAKMGQESINILVSGLDTYLTAKVYGLKKIPCTVVDSSKNIPSKYREKTINQLIEYLKTLKTMEV